MCIRRHVCISTAQSWLSKDAGMKAAVTLNPATPVGLLEDIIGELDMVLLMAVNPGFGGQKFIENAVAKTRRLKELIKKFRLECNH